jgi:ankyrin repeat protein
MNKVNDDLIQAAKSGNVKDFEAAIEAGADVNCCETGGATPLAIAAKCRPDLVKRLLDAGADVSLPGEDRITPLHQAVEYDNEEIVSILLERGADVGARDGLEETPVHWAAWTGHHRTGKLLLKAGGDPLLPNGGGFSPLDLAKMQSHDTVIKLFSNRDVT